MRAREAGLTAFLAVQCGRPPEPAVPTLEPLVGAPAARPPSEARPSEKIRLCSWNIAKLSHGDAKDFGVIRAVLEENWDLAAIEEVMQKAGGHPGYENLMTALGDDWSGWPPGRRSRGP
jgi:hypothetical protein